MAHAIGAFSGGACSIGILGAVSLAARRGGWNVTMLFLFTRAARFGTWAIFKPCAWAVISARQHPRIADAAMRSCQFIAKNGVIW